MAKKVTVFLNRRITLNREGFEPIALEPGANVVDSDVAEHGFVKAHTIAAVESGGVDLAVKLQSATEAHAVAVKRAEAAEARAEELQAAADAAEKKAADAIDAHAAAIKRAEAAEAKAAELQAVADAAAAMGGTGATPPAPNGKTGK